MQIAFVHPDLGIGGAERLVLDAAVGLQALGHDIVIYTSYRDKDHCFPEARDGTIEVRVRGDTVVPASILGRFAILCAMLRQIHLAYSLLTDKDKYDAIFIDQLSICIPVLKFFKPQMRVLFYCHFPDKLLSTRTSLVKELYRVPFDLLEGWSTGLADRIIVNSHFTASIFKKAFPRIQQTPEVIYPCVNTKESVAKQSIEAQSKRIALSINRFERKKNIELAIAAFSLLKRHEHFEESVLVIAGGYDHRVGENVSYHRALQDFSSSKGLSHRTLEAPWTSSLVLETDVNVYFLLSIPAEMKAGLLSTSSVLLYTPENEHFGIVPIEASLAELPVIAQNNGGPLETIEDGITGYSRPGIPAQWAEVMQTVMFDMTEDERRQMGKHGRAKVLEQFSRETMSKALSVELESIELGSSASVHRSYVFLAASFFILLVLLLWQASK